LSDRTHQSISSDRYDEAYFLGSCEGYTEFIASEGAHLSRRLHQAFELAEVEPGMRVLDVGCGRGEILSHCVALGAKPHGIDYAAVAVRMARAAGPVYQADAKRLPFASDAFDRVLMFDIVEHLYPWELDRALVEVSRVLRPDGRLVIHTAPNVWYDRFAYPVVRLVRSLMGQGEKYPREPRAIVPANLDVHVNEQSLLSLWWVLNRLGFQAQVWLDTPLQNRDEGPFLSAMRHVLFNWPPFNLFFEREVFAVARLNHSDE